MAEPRATDGILLVDKPTGPTSHDVVARARRALRNRRIGHTGTLDPFASGLLVLLVGRMTRLLPYVNGEPKVYEARIRFGRETTTDDRTGEPLREAPAPSSDAVDAAVRALTGDLDQLPPSYSAKKVGGERAYDAARRGAPLELRAARVHVDEWRTRWGADGDLEATITCGSGTYIRSLARDLGRLSGSAAHLAELRRLRSGPYDVAQAIALDDLAAVGSPDAVPLRAPLEALVPIVVHVAGPDDVRRVARGQTVPAADPGERAAIVDDERNLVAIAERGGDVWCPRVVLTDG